MNDGEYRVELKAGDTVRIEAWGRILSDGGRLDAMAAELIADYEKLARTGIDARRVARLFRIPLRVFDGSIRRRKSRGKRIHERRRKAAERRRH